MSNWKKEKKIRGRWKEIGVVTTKLIENNLNFKARSRVENWILTFFLHFHFATFSPSSFVFYFIPFPKIMFFHRRGESWRELNERRRKNANLILFWKEFQIWKWHHLLENGLYFSSFLLRFHTFPFSFLWLHPTMSSCRS